MNLRLPKKRAQERGWAIIAVMTLATGGLLMLASLMNWANENSTVTTRNSEYFTTTYAAEAATEKALSAMVQDDQDYGEGVVLSQTSTYGGLVPTASDNPYWTNYTFSGGTSANTILVSRVSSSTTNTLGPPYAGLQSIGATYDIIATAKNNTSMYGISSTVGQKITFGQIPIFQFAIFYQDTMEIDPGANMTIAGLVHGNNNIYLAPNAVTLTFSGDVSSSGNIYLTENPLDPTGQSAGTVNFNGANHVSGVNPLNLPVGTNTSGTATNIAQNVLSILQVPPASEAPSSAAGTNRLFNQVDLIITISNGNAITVTSGVDINGRATTISNSQWANFVSTNGSFDDQREGQTVDPLDINVGNLRSWSATNTVLRPLLQSQRGSSLADVSSVYVVDERSLTNIVIVTNISYTTNTSTTTTTSYPSSGTYVPPVATNTLTTTSSNYPGTGTYFPPVNTETTTTTVSGWNNPPTAGTYVPPATTNTTSTTSSTKPTTGSYLGSYTQSGGKYHYSAIVSYTYNLITGYIYSGITGYTYAHITGIITNITYSTNYIQIALPGVVLTNGATLPPNGLSVATPDPAYIVGNWNVSSNGTTMSLQTTNTANTLPSAVFADAITILSPAWNPANSSLSLTNRTATADTVNAAFLTGNVPSNGSTYSGGVENFPRFLENWSGLNFYYNGSMVEMFPSQIANAAWPGTGTVYNPPTRDWTFDNNFNNPSDLPPLTPRVINIIRSQWATLPVGTTAANF
jgi:hypothetical protein